MNDRELSSFRNANIGFVFQSFNLLDRLTALENVGMSAFLLNELASPAARSHLAGAGTIAVSAAGSRGLDVARGGCAAIHDAFGRDGGCLIVSHARFPLPSIDSPCCGQTGAFAPDPCV